MSTDARHEELQIEIERLKAWINKIGNEAWKGTPLPVIEGLCETAIKHGSCVVHPNWEPTEDWAPLGEWPPKHARETT